MAQTLAQIRTEVRRLLYEASADLWTDADINAHINAEIRRLPSRKIYLEELWQANKVVNQQDYSLPSGTVKMEDLEENFGSATVPDWRPMKGWYLYGGALWLASPAADTHEMRAKLRKEFTYPLSTDTTVTDVPDNKIDVVIYGAAIRAYEQLIGYLVDAKNYDAIVKPDGISMTQIRGWILELKRERDAIVRELRQIPRPKDIDLVG